MKGTIFFILGFAACAFSVEVTPVEKVITLLEDLKSETEAAGKKEASTYDTFACFCKDTTIEKSDAIKAEQDNIDEIAATLEEQTGVSNAKQAESEELAAMIKTLDKEMVDITAMREKEKAKYEATAADMAKSVASLEGAIADIQAGLGGAAASFLSIKKNIKKSINMARDLDLGLGASPKQQRAMSVLLQTDADDAPEGDFDSHSDDIIAVLTDLEKEFKAKAAAVDQEEGQNKKDFNEQIKAKTNEKKQAKIDKKTAEGDKAQADENIAKASEDMVKEEALLKDDELYMKDLTTKCELKAREWDQRSQMRSEEVTALTAAIKIIKEGVVDNSAVNKRAFIQNEAQPIKTPERKEDPRDSAEEDSLDGMDVDLSFVQLSQQPRMKIASLVKQASKVTQTLSEAQQAAKKEKVIKSLVASGNKLGSANLAALAMRVQADPFIKVKKLIQDLIERLVTEAAEEATKKGWCDTELGKATHTRDSNMDTIMELNAELEGLEATKAKLEEEIATLTTEIADLNDSLTKETKMRADEKAENMDTLDKAKAGLAATKDAYDVLTTFYKKSAKGKVSLIQASPVDADSPASPSGAYKGGQQKAGGILAMLDVIISDFERTIKVTTKAEKASHREFVEFERTSKTSIASKETGKSQAESDLKSTDSKIAEGMDDLDKHQEMLDDVLKELEDLKPACVDTGMSYADRVQKRKDEIDALKKALCELDPEKVEDECK